MNRATKITKTAGAALVTLFCMTIPTLAELTHAPALTLADLKGSKVNVDYRAGKLTLVNFWAVWCGPCREEMPHIARLFGKYGKQGFQAVGIAVQSGEPSDVKEFLEQNKDYGINYPILMGVDETLTRFGDVQAVPTTFLIDPTGKVVRRFIGVTPGFAVKLEDEISKALTSKPSEPSNPPKQ